MSNGLFRPRDRERVMVLSRHFAGPAFRCRARIGRKIRNASAFPQVTGMALKPRKIVKVFKLCLLPVPPAGFEPALTAPESVSRYRSDLPKRARRDLVRARIGRSPPRLRRAGVRPACPALRCGGSHLPCAAGGRHGKPPDGVKPARRAAGKLEDPPDGGRWGPVRSSGRRLGPAWRPTGGQAGAGRERAGTAAPPRAPG